MSIRLWVDDERPAPEGWSGVTTSAQAIEVLQTSTVQDMSLDYCLKGMDDGGQVLEWLRDHPERYPTGNVVAHSSSSSGCALLERMISDIEDTLER